MITHIPVLLREVLFYLGPKPNQSFLDGTVGQGGHAEALLERILPRGRLLGIDRDLDNLTIAKQRLSRFGDAVVFVHDSYAAAAEHAYAHGFSSVDGVLLDLGISSCHVDDPTRGFSFQADGPLDMRFDTRQSLTARQIVNEWEEEALARLFRIYGEERAADRIAQVICERRKRKAIRTTFELVDVITSVKPRRGRQHPATHVFQALRIATNDELRELERALPMLAELIKSKGRLVVISFHSLEDRIVKNFLRLRTDFQILTKRVVKPSRAEILANPRSRSAVLRAAEKK